MKMINVNAVVGEVEWDGGKSPSVDSYEGIEGAGGVCSAVELVEPVVEVPQLWRKGRGGARANSGRKKGAGVSLSAHERMRLRASQRLLEIALELMEGCHGNKGRRKGRKGAKDGRDARDGKDGSSLKQANEAAGEGEAVPVEESRSKGIDFANLKIVYGLMLADEGAVLDRLRFERSVEEKEKEKEMEPPSEGEMERMIQVAIGKEFTIV